jgi:hypothetical protein
LRRLVLGFSALTLVILLLSILGGYRAYEYTESVEFCGKLCHSVMEPEHVAFLDSPHARVHCVDCHVGEGPGWYLKAKISGLRQVYQLTANTLSRPIETPLEEMRSAQETCLRCHWPEKSFEDQLLPRTHFAHDQLNTRRSFLILLKTGQRSTNGERRKGIHWHASSGNRVEYVAADARRSKILQVRSVLHEGPSVEYSNPEETSDPAALAGMERRVLDCTDCHNRPGHPFLSPEAAVDEAMERGAIDAAVPFAKTAAVAVLAAAGADLEEGGAAHFEEQLRKIYSERHASVMEEASGAFPALARELDRLHRRNVFPSMKVTWAAYPDHSGHRESAGCLRCHDGKHRTADGKVLSGACDLCHEFAAYAPDGSGLLSLPADASFLHPWKDEKHATLACSTCHTGQGSPYETCTRCHDAEPEAPMAFACSSCHRPMKVEVEANDCLPCHDLSGSKLHATKGHADCTHCHKEHEWRTVDTPDDCTGSCHEGLEKPHHDDGACVPCHDFKGVSSQQALIPGPASREK